jgi:hypothetical protein
MKTSQLIALGILTIFILAVGALFFKCDSEWCLWTDWQRERAVESFEQCVEMGFAITSYDPRECRAGDKVFTEGGGVREEGDGEPALPQPVETSMIRVDSPLPGSSVSSPLVVKGEARGNWYFEASFPVRLLDANGNQIAAAPAQAKGDWMTTEFVPFEVTLNFSSPVSSTGTLVLEKDNPSGLPENAAEVRVPVRFGKTSEAQSTIVLYYYDEDKDKDASGNVLCSAQGLAGVERHVPATITPIQDSIKLLLRGELSSAEKAQGISTEFPLSGLSLKGASLSGGVLTLEFNDPQNKTSGGSCRVNILRAQIEATAKQFTGVNSVRIIPDQLFQP